MEAILIILVIAVLVRMFYLEDKIKQLNDKQDETHERLDLIIKELETLNKIKME